MLELLGGELLAAVLQCLPTKNDLHNARQASKLFDAASRNHLDRATTLTLEPGCICHHAGGQPNFARFPRLRRICLEEWRRHSADAYDKGQLIACLMGAPPEQLAGVSRGGGMPL